jgi:hypothetical protein
MSSKPIAARSRIKLRTREAGAYVHAATPHGVAKKTEDLQVLLDLPPRRRFWTASCARLRFKQRVLTPDRIADLLKSLIERQSREERVRRRPAAGSAEQASAPPRNNACRGGGGLGLELARQRPKRSWVAHARRRSAAYDGATGAATLAGDTRIGLRK